MNIWMGFYNFHEIYKRKTSYMGWHDIGQAIDIG